jgi:hypothetical protein
VIHESRMQEYKDCMAFALELAKIHDCIFYVYDMDGTYQCTPTIDDGMALAGRVWPGGRMEAHALMSPKGGLLR